MPKLDRVVLAFIPVSVEKAQNSTLDEVVDPNKAKENVQVDNNWGIRPAHDTHLI